MSAKSQAKTKSFIKGAMLLAAATLLVRLVGVIYRPLVKAIFAPFDGAAGVYGVGLTSVPIATYQVVFSFTAIGLSVGISKLVAERTAVGDIAGAKRVFRLSRTLMTALGLTASLLLWFGAPYIPTMFSAELENAVPGFRAIAPALLIASLMAAYRGLFQGVQELGVSAGSQIVEQVVRIVAGLGLTYLLVSQSVPLGAAGYNAGEVFGGLAALIYLLWMARRANEYLRSAAGGSEVLEPARRERTWTVMKRILAVATPMALSGAIVPLMGQADSLILYKVLSAAGVPGDTITTEFGYLTMAFQLIYLPTIFTTALYTSLLPSLTDAVATGQVKTARHRTRQAYRLTMLLALPSQVGMYVLAGGIFALIYVGDTGGGHALGALSWGVAAILLQQVSAGVLQGYGHFGLPLRNSLIGLAVKVVLTWFWAAQLGIAGAAYATAIGFAVAALLNLWNSQRIIGRTLDIRGMFIKPLFAAAAMGGTIWTLQMALDEIVPFWLLTLGLVGLGGLVYGLALLLVGGISADDLEAMPKVGPRLVRVLTRLRLIR